MVKTVKKNESNGLGTIICDALANDWYFLSKERMGIQWYGMVDGWYTIYYSVLENKIYVSNLKTFDAFFDRLLGQYKNHLHGKRNYVQDLLFVDLRVQFNFLQTYIKNETEVETLIRKEDVKEELSAIVKSNIIGLDYKDLSLPALKKERIEIDNSRPWDSQRLERILEKTYYYFSTPINTLSFLFSFKGEKIIDFYSTRKSIISIMYLINNILKPNLCSGGELASPLETFDEKTFIKTRNFTYFDCNFEEDLKKIPQGYLEELFESVPLSKLSPKKIAVIVKLFGEDFFDKKSWLEYGKDFLSIGIKSSEVDFSDKNFDLAEVDDNYINRKQFLDLVLRKSGVDVVNVSTYSILCDSDKIGKVIPYIIEYKELGKIKKINIVSESWPGDIDYPSNIFKQRLQTLNLFHAYNGAESVLYLEDYLGDSQIKKFLPFIKKLKESVDLYNELK